MDEQIKQTKPNKCFQYFDGYLLTHWLTLIYIKYLLIWVIFANFMAEISDYLKVNTFQLTENRYILKKQFCYNFQVSTSDLLN